MEKLSAEAWWTLAQELHYLITQEIKVATDDSLSVLYPKFVTMYEFFRFIRGESFRLERPDGLVEYQGRLYQMEDEIGRLLQGVESKLNLNDPQTKHRFDIMKRAAEII